MARTMVHQAPSTLALTLSTGEVIETTGEHPFYVSGQGFVQAKDLGIGTSLVTRAGPQVTVVRIAWKERAATVYNLTVEGTHTYFVGANGGGVWVHNKPDFDEVVPSKLRLPPDKTEPDMDKFMDQIREFGSGRDGMPPIEVTLGMNGEMMINDGVTRASRIDYFNSLNGTNTTVPVVITGHQPGIEFGGLPRVGDLHPR